MTEWPELADVDWAAVAARRCARALFDRRSQHARPRDDARGGLRVRGHRPRGRAARAPDGGDRPRGRQGRAPRRRRGRAARSRSSRSAAGRCSPGRSAGSRQAGVDRVIVSCLAGQEHDVRATASAVLGRRDRLRGRARAARARRRDPLRGGCRARGRRRARDERRRARRRRLRCAARAASLRPAPRRPSPSRSRRRSSARSTSTDDDVVTGFHEVSRVPYWVNCGIYVLSEEALERFPEKGDHETHDLPGARRRGEAARVPAHGPLADGEHPEGAPPRRRVRLRPSGVARVSSRFARRAAPRRQALGLGARLGRDGGLRRQAPLRARRPVAEPPVPRGEGRVVARAAGPRVARAGRGRRRPRDDRDRARTTSSATARAPCIA